MIVSVTALGARNGDAVTAVARVVNYLDGRSPEAAGRSPEWWEGRDLADKAPCEHGLAAGDGALAYYADSVEGPGTWMGRGLGGFAPEGEVARVELERMLLGQDPSSGHQLLDGRGSAQRAHRLGREGVAVAPTGPGDELLTMPQAASLLGVSPQYLRRLASATAAARLDSDPTEAGQPLPALDHPYLDAAHGGPNGHWRVSRAEVTRFAEARTPPTAVIGYDLTFSVPKSVSLLWAWAEPERQAAIVAAVNEAVAAGVGYLEENAAFVRSGSDGHVQRAHGLLAASYVHGTSRALDPQLHAHVVVANMAEGPDGAVGALDGRALFAHAKTASYLAAAELRLQLTRRLGVEWEPAERGLADVAGVSREAIVEMSKRSRELDSVLPELEAFYSSGRHARAQGRQVAAYITRAAKEEHGVDPDALRPWWQTQLDVVGFDAKAVRRCLERQPAPALVTHDDGRELFARLGSPDGVTHMAATFGRRDVIQHVADWAGDRLDATAICDLADTWLASDVVVRLEPERREGRGCDVVRLRTGRTVNAVGVEALYTTEGMLAVERQLLDSYSRGRSVGAAAVPEATVEAVLASRPELGEDQVAMVRSICTSGHRIQCVLGPAGSGKTFALAAAARAWEDAGYRPIGAVVGGTATEVLRDSTGMKCSTVASLLHRLDVMGQNLDHRNVVLVDEASTIGNRDLARLASYVERDGAAMRCVGDPAQHSAVAAGGGWRALLERFSEDRAELWIRRRQAAPEMTEVRLASIDYAAGRISDAIDRLRRDERVVEADTPDELLDMLVADWYVDRLRHETDPHIPASSMVADHHSERRELNRRARAILASQGVLRGPVVEAGGQCFQKGDQVIAVQQDRDLRPAGAKRNNFVHNAERGLVVEARLGPHPALVVDFDRRGPVLVDESHLTKKVRPGVVGQLAHSYAVTSHASQGETYHAGRHLSTDASSREGVYVGLTRGRGDARLYMVRQRDLSPPADQHLGLPRLEDDTATEQAVLRSLQAQQAERLASEIDPDAAGVAQLARAHNLAQLASLAAATADPTASPPGRAYRQVASSIAANACLRPDPALVARLGPRPQGGDERRTWDQAVAAVAIYRARWDATPMPAAPAGAWALGPEPTGPGAAHHRSSAALVAAAERAYLLRQPPADLAAERRTLVGVLAAGSGPGHYQRAAAAVALATQELTAAQAGRDRASERLQALEEAPRRRRNPQAMELARRDLDVAEGGCAADALTLQRAQTALDAAEQKAPAQKATTERLALVDDALDHRAQAAVATTAPYLVGALGHRPSADEHAREWDTAATRIETYRHRDLGLGPDDGAALDDDGIVGAIGPRPHHYADALAWDHVAELAAPELVPSVELPGPTLEL